MAVPVGVILIWLGTNASIPTGWVRETSLDDKYPKAWGTVAPNNTGGALTHSHTSTSHTHTMNGHTHTFSLSADSSPENHFFHDPSSVIVPHTHQGTSSTTSGGDLQENAVTWALAGNEPLNYKAIFIKPSTSPKAMVAGISAFFNGDTLPPGYVYCDGDNSTPDLRGRYLRGGTTSEDSGIGGGTNNHNHSLTHTHTANAHSHTGTSNANDSADRVKSGGGTNQGSLNGHTHPVTLNNSTVTVDNYTNTTAGSSDTVEPAYKKVGIIQNKTGAMPKGLIGLWLGSVASIPGGWKLCDGNNNTLDLRDKFIKCADSLAQIGDEGGSNTHSHTTVSHTHTSQGHTHSGSSSASGGAGLTWSDGLSYSHYQHTHAVINVQSVQATYSNANIDCGTVDNQPEHRTVAYIQFGGGMGGASLLYNLI